jgi:hypothetical protein
MPGAPRNIEEGREEGTGDRRVSGKVGRQKQKAETSSEARPLLSSLTRLPAYPPTRFHDGSFATCMTSVPAGISGEITLSSMPVAVRSRT